jgi:hypothetical protein
MYAEDTSEGGSKRVSDITLLSLSHLWRQSRRCRIQSDLKSRPSPGCRRRTKRGGSRGQAKAADPCGLWTRAGGPRS